ncbi:MAG TPA: M55 family metallopeptidase [Planctomycetota bacterium]|nr:M55 family metallopeptidase [Planctomycetota bacterium]
MKKIYVVADMPGTSGICAAEQCRWGHFLWREARAHLASDVNAAIEGAFAGGADEVVVCDAHGGACNLPMERMDPRAMYEPANREELLPGLSAEFAGLFVVGAHAMAGAVEAFMCHTVDAETWFRYRLAGRECGEIGMWAAWAGHHGVPLLLVTGDAAACREAEEFAPGVALAAVKEAVAWDRARTLHPVEGRARIAAACRRAMEQIGRIEPTLIDMPNEAELEYVRCEFADEAAGRQGAERTGPRTVRRALESIMDLRRGF